MSSNHDKLLENQDPQIIILDDRLVKVSTESKLNGQAGYPFEERYIDWSKEPAEYIKSANFSETEKMLTKDTSFVNRNEYEITNEEKEILGYAVRKAVTTVNSNTIEPWYTEDLPYKASPVNIGLELGVV